MKAIVVQCSAESHEGKVVRLAMFFERGGPGNWSSMPPPEAREVERRIDADDVPLTPGRNLDQWKAGRSRFDFRCRLCGEAVVARAEKLYPIFDKLRNAEIRTIELARLGAILRSAT